MLKRNLEIYIKINFIVQKVKKKLIIKVYVIAEVEKYRNVHFLFNGNIRR